MEERIHQSLLQLENDLKDLNSAREQVESIVEAHKSLKESVEKYVSILANLQTDSNELLKEITTEYKDNLEKTKLSIKDFGTKCGEIIVSFDKKTTVISATLQTSIDNAVNAFDDKIQKLNSSIESLKELYKSFDNSIKTIEETKGTLDKILEELISSQKTQDEILNTIKNELHQLTSQTKEEFSKLDVLIQKSEQRIKESVSTATDLITDCINNVGKEVHNNGNNITQIQNVQNQQLSILTGAINSINNIAQSVSELSLDIKNTNNNIQDLNNKLTLISKESLDRFEKQKGMSIAILVVVILSFIASIACIILK